MSLSLKMSGKYVDSPGLCRGDRMKKNKQKQQKLASLASGSLPSEMLLVRKTNSHTTLQKEKMPN